MKCEFYKTCPDYRKEAISCNKHGGRRGKKDQQPYCGKWREFMVAKQ